MFTGFILTDTRRLAEVLDETPSRILDVLDAYIQDCSSYINWVLVDTADPMYADIDKEDWQAYAAVLDDYYVGIGLQNSYNCPLFIIGGEEVVPMPVIENPLLTIGREYLSADMLYCFDIHNSSEIRMVTEKPRFAVGRLPLTDEFAMVDLQNYLDACVVRTKAGIPVRGAAMTTTESWLHVSKEMMRDIPVASLSEEYVPLNERMIVSPLLDTSYQDMYDGYVHELKKVDFLVCNLHGNDQPGTPYFIGEDKSRMIKTIATQPSMLEQTSPLVFNTVSCHGARYTGYALDDSMLLSAMAYGTMLYCGPCDNALGGCDKMGNAIEGKSESLMKLYMVYLHQGQPAGMALLKAKQDYYRTCHMFDGDERAMYTILEFNLFGCPLLSIQPKLSRDYKPELHGNRIDEYQTVTYQPKQAKAVMSSAFQAEDIHAYVQGLVNNNLAMIRAKVEEQVYQRLGLGKENLRNVYCMSQNNHEIGYQFLYHWTPQGSYRQFEMYYLVDTDMQGGITNITHTK